MFVMLFDLVEFTAQVEQLMKRRCILFFYCFSICVNIWFWRYL